MDVEEALVCDASVLAAITFAEPGSSEAVSLTGSRRLFAPSLLRYEMVHVAARKCRVQPDCASLVEQALVASLRVPIRLVEPWWLGVLRLAQETELTAYDASYLQLALDLHMPIATLDKRLARAAAALGVDAPSRL